MDAFFLDLKYAGRSLWRSKGFAVTVLLTFAVCIAANTALFAIVNSVVLRPLPVPEANSILLMSNEYPKAGVIGLNGSSSGDYFDRLKEITVFESQAEFRQRDQTVEVNSLPQRTRAMAVTPSWFTLLRVTPALGTLMLHGVVPGPSLMTQGMPTVYSMFILLGLATLLMLVFGVVGVGVWVRLVRIPRPFLAVTILTLSLVGSFCIRSNVIDIVYAIAFGLLGYLIRRANLSVVPMVLALALGDLIEDQLRRALVMSDYGGAIFLHRPVSLGLLCFAAVTFLCQYTRQRGRR